MTKSWNRILALAAFWLAAISLPAGVNARAPQRARPIRQAPRQGLSVRARQGPSDHEMLLQLKDGQEALQRQIVDLRQSLKEQVTLTTESARDTNDRLEKQTVQGFHMLGGRIGFIQTLLVLIFAALLALLGGAFLIWQRLIMLERSLGQKLGTMEQKVRDLQEQSNKWVAGP